MGAGARGGEAGPGRCAGGCAPLGVLLRGSRACGLELPALTLPVLAGLRAALLRGTAAGLSPCEASSVLALVTGQPPLHCDLAWMEVEKAEPGLVRGLEGRREAAFPPEGLLPLGGGVEAAATAMKQAWREYWGGLQHAMLLQKSQQGGVAAAAPSHFRPGKRKPASTKKVAAGGGGGVSRKGRVSRGKAGVRAAGKASRGALQTQPASPCHALKAC